MAVKVHIPTPLRQYADGLQTIEVQGATVADALFAVTEKYNRLRRQLYDDSGRLRNFVNVYVNESDIRNLDRHETPLKDGDVVTIVPSIAGGSFGLRSGPAPPGPGGLTHEEIRRYSRHLIMPEVGLEGQARLKKGSVLCVGTGGLGSPLALYLAAAGIGRIGLVDFDVVDESNLQRQIIHTTKDVGKPKLKSAMEKIQALNPNVVIETYEARLSSENAMEILAKYDVIVDGTDNFPTRYLVNDACVLLKKPNVYGSIFRFDGQASVFWAEKGPCYRCLYEEPPPPGLVPSCAEGGVLGILPGVIGVIQATEAIKLIIGKGEPLIGRLLLYDALSMSFRELKLQKNPDCVICGKNPTVTKLIDYELFCGVQEQVALEKEFVISPKELAAKVQQGESVQVIDVREPHEWDIVHLPYAKLIPLKDVPARANELSTADEIVMHCHHGMRSQQAVNVLRQLGFRRVKNLVGGIDRYAEEVDPSMARY
jgi:adenylyltransferase/sulfurtransferase